MRIALIASPFIPVPPIRYGGTELFVAHLAEGLSKMGHDVVVYANGESTVQAELRWYYRQTMWPPVGDFSETLKEITHTSWAIRDESETCDVIHLNNTFGLPYSRFLETPFVCTIHHPHEKALTEFYCQYPQAQYVTISKYSQQFEMMPNVCTIHHGINISKYSFVAKKSPYFSFLGRIVPVKGAHAAIEIAKRTGIPLKIAGEVQPMFRDYFEQKIAPQIDGKFIEYLGEADFATKNELLANSMAMLFPIEWDEPFGLTMIEAMACGTPVLALSGGSVPEIVRNGVSGFACSSLNELIGRVPELSKLNAFSIRQYAEEHFSVEKMANAYLQLYSAITQEVSPAEITELADLNVIKLPAA
ncbi:MAG TPA: glycosyltransferase family 4 protein [Terriglobales bacterium]|nr:glycosyltransferase family 4 protein [Terriglobales bacterium]